MRSASVELTPDNASATASEGKIPDDELTGVTRDVTPDDALAIASGGAHQMMQQQFHQEG